MGATHFTFKTIQHFTTVSTRRHLQQELNFSFSCDINYLQTYSRIDYLQYLINSRSDKINRIHFASTFTINIIRSNEVTSVCRFYAIDITLSIRSSKMIAL